MPFRTVFGESKRKGEVTTLRLTDLVVGQLLRLRNENSAANFTLGVRKQVTVFLDHLVDCKAETKTRHSAHSTIRHGIVWDNL